MDNRILVVDDEKDICDILQFNLEKEGYIVDVANSAEEALMVITDVHQLIVLDVMMDGISGFKMAEKLRKQGNYIPIIFLTAKNTENDVLTGFSLGGDDYIAKPFSIKEVLSFLSNSASVKILSHSLNFNSFSSFSLFIALLYNV